MIIVRKVLKTRDGFERIDETQAEDNELQHLVSLIVLPASKLTLRNYELDTTQAAQLSENRRFRLMGKKRIIVLDYEEI